jgi:hypothetical protein
MADQLLYEVSNSTELSGEPFIRKENVYIIDQNNGSYSNNQILLDCAAVSNAGKWADFQNAVVQVPLIHTLSSTVDFAAVGVNTDFSQGLKNGFHNIVSSLNVEYNNSSVVQISNYTNMFISFKLHTTLSENDITTIGSQIGYFKDSSQSWQYQAAASVSGSGSCNNRQSASSTAAFNVAYSGTAGNVGFSQRQLQTTFNAGQTGVQNILGAAAAWLPISNTFGRPTMRKSADGAGGRYMQSWCILATLRLKDLSDFFAQMPLVRNAYMKIYINLNQSVVSWTSAGVGGVITLTNNTASSISVFGGNTNPLMIASAAAGCGNATLPAGAYVSSVGVLNSLDTNLTSTDFSKNPMMSSCRLYIDLYTMNPLKEEQYLLNRTKTIKYRDFFQFQLLNQSLSINALISNGISNLKQIVVVPTIASTVNGVAGGAVFSPNASPFTSEPATCSPLQYFSSLNFQISGVNIFTNNEVYGFEAFQNELYGVGSVNGGLTDGLSSGLISQTDFYNNYGYIVADVSRRLPEEDKTPKSVQLSMTISTALAMDLFVFCVFEKEIVIDTYSGRRVM